MPKKKRKVTKKNTTKRAKTKQEDLSWAVVGIVGILVAILAITRVGMLGKQVANLVRIFFGNSYLLASALIALFGLVMLIYNQPPHLKVKRIIGLIIAIFGVLMIQSSMFFNQEAVNTGFLNAFWTAMGSEFNRAAITESVGGGLIGTVGFQIFYPLLGQIGIRVIAVCLVPIGIMMFFDIKFRTIVEEVQKIGQAFIEKNKDIAPKIKTKYAEMREEQLKRKQVKTENSSRQFKDPLDQTDIIFPNTDDFENQDEMKDTKISSSKSEPEMEPNLKDDSIPEPEIQMPEPVEEINERLISENSSKKETKVEPEKQYQPSILPKSHAFEDEDKKLKQNLSQVKHDSTKTSAPIINPTYKKPPLTLLDPIKNMDQSADRDLIKKNTQTLQATFKSFGVDVIIKKAILGPTITRYEVQPAVGVKVSRIVNLSDDLALALAAKDIRIEAPIPGKPYIGIEVPNKTTSVVSFKDVMEHQDDQAKKDIMEVPLGKDVAGATISANLAKMPHLLIAGSTGSGKSVAINTILTSILMKARPEEIKLVLIDPKMVELSVYNNVPHLLIPVVTDAKLASKSLHKVVKEMERRYKLFAASGARNMGEYNQKVEQNNQDKSKPAMKKLPYILVVVDELSDLMMVGGHDVEGAIVRLGQMARAAGIHMILATQRPSVDVITGLIKANVPSRISFAVSSGVDSRTILDQTGAEKLLGRGDMLYMPIGASKPERIQGAYIASHEVEKVISWVKEQQQAKYDEAMIPQNSTDNSSENEDDPEDELYPKAVDLVRRQQSASVSMLQRRFRIGYNRAARIVDEMEAKGIVGPSEGSKPREVLLPPIKDEEGK
ncbi:DNA translocase FtsK [Lactobacillus sp. LL6]|uniref:FtsK/SpoIIIE family DNA translocase n=1 Tax=Lactobacillus sp. LL6 TaxID=2596827 RepID=UPI0011848120|nr:DNA translocase FtsK [Lactobacillus sp. LL6]TSO26002.1 DNA translocase FtsK [Lactobacillus sp. LL6]